MKYAIDRIEDNIAVLENINDKTIINIDISKLPNGIKEGDIIIKEETFTIDIEETNKRKNEIEDRFNSLIGDK